MDFISEYFIYYFLKKFRNKAEKMYQNVTKSIGVIPIIILIIGFMSYLYTIGYNGSLLVFCVALVLVKFVWKNRVYNILVIGEPGSVRSIRMFPIQILQDTHLITKYISKGSSVDQIFHPMCDNIYAFKENGSRVEVLNSHVIIPTSAGLFMDVSCKEKIQRLFLVEKITVNVNIDSIERDLNKSIWKMLQYETLYRWDIVIDITPQTQRNKVPVALIWRQKTLRRTDAIMMNGKFHTTFKMSFPSDSLSGKLSIDCLGFRKSVDIGFMTEEQYKFNMLQNNK